MAQQDNSIALRAFEGPSPVQNFLSAQRDAQAYRQNEANMERQKVVAGRDDQQYADQQNTQALDRLGAVLDQVKDGDAAGFEQAKSFAVQNKLIDPNEAQRYTVNDLPKIRALSQQARQMAAERSKAAMSEREFGLKERGAQLDERQFAETVRSHRANEGIAATKAAASDFGPDDIDEDSLDYAATVLRQTGRMPPMGQGKAGTAARREILRRAAAQAKAESGTTRGGAIGDLASAADYAGSRTGINALDRRSANLDAAAREVQAFSKNALTASAGVPRTSWLPVNEAIKYYRSQSGSPEQRAFGQYNLSLANAYAVVANRGGQPTVSSQQEALKHLNDADGPEAYEAAVNAILTETQAAMESTAQSRGDILKRIRGEKVEHGAPEGGEKKEGATPKRIKFDAQGNRVQ